MVRRSLGLLAGGLLTIALAAPAALAGPAVTVRVEGAADTLVARSGITLGAADVVKDGHSCGGGTGAAALDSATAGSWSGPWYDSFGDFGVETVKGETYSFASGKFWSFFLNGYSAPTGICSTTLQQGDSLVFAPVDAAATTVALLSVSGVPAKVAPGVPFDVTVKRLATTTEPPDYISVRSEAPAAGATVTADGASATTGADGKATLTLTTPGPTTLRAANATDVRSASEPVCVTAGADGFCDTVKPGHQAPASGSAPASAALDRVVPLGTLSAIGEQQRYARGKAPRELRGDVAGEASGIADIRLRLTRRNGKRCERYDGAGERWVRMTRCGAQNGTFFSVGDRTPWSYLLPQALTKGRYVLDTQVVDRAGNATRGATRGNPGEARNRVVFHVG